MTTKYSKHLRRYLPVGPWRRKTRRSVLDPTAWADHRSEYIRCEVLSPKLSSHRCLLTAVWPGTRIVARKAPTLVLLFLIRAEQQQSNGRI